MSLVLSEIIEGVQYLTLNRPEKHNAFDEHMLSALLDAVTRAVADDTVHVIVFKAAGKHFCAGADLGWMQRVATYPEAENIADAMVLARVMNVIYKSQKPTIASVQGAAMGGGAGIVAACDIAIVADNASFCFSEVKLGLVPAVISPYVVEAIGARRSRALFLSAERFGAREAYDYGLVHKVVSADALQAATTDYARTLARLPKGAQSLCKTLVDTVKSKPIDEEILTYTATLIALRRASPEAQEALLAFLNSSK